MYQLAILALPAIGIALIVYLSISAKMWSQPWRFLAIALFIMVLSFGFQLAVDQLALALDIKDPGAKHLVNLKGGLTLINLVVGSFAGALIGIAVTNRAMHLNSEELRTLREQADRYASEAEKMKELLEKIGPEPSAPNDIKQRKFAERMFIEATIDLRETLEKERKLSL